MKDVICNELKQITLPIHYPLVTVHYVLKDGKMANIPETQHLCKPNIEWLVRSNEIMAKDQKEEEESSKQFAIVKDNVNQILSPY